MSLLTDIPVEVVVKKLLILIFVFSSIKGFSAEEIRLGEEYIEPVRFPRFSLSGEYVMTRKFLGFSSSDLRADLGNRFESVLLFEANIYKYFNAGGLFSCSFSAIKKGEPLAFKFGMFAKPFFPLGSRVALYARVSAGLAVDIAFGGGAASYYGEQVGKSVMDRVYLGQEYKGWPAGAFGAATIGIEAFPLSRLGLAFEWGIRSTVELAMKSMPMMQEIKDVPGAPGVFSFMYYEMPLMFTLHYII